MKKIYETMEKIARPIEKVILTIAGIGMAVIAIIIFIQVIFRVCLSNSLSWTEEIARYTEVWIVFLTAGYALGHGQHICMDLLTNILPENAKFIMEKVIAVICCVFSALLIKYAYNYMITEKMQMFASMQISKSVVYAAMFVGFILCLFYSLMNLFRPKEVKE